jgi:hypothetical protein
MIHGSPEVLITIQRSEVAPRDEPGYISNMKWWDWLGTLSQGQAAFLGSLVGALVGLFALLLGALFNARQNRKRDDRLAMCWRAVLVMPEGQRPHPWRP